ncbi:transcription factor Tfb2-domain-containing protein [Tribonema minus]|uniref:General transcription factor IIH subunit 4 n=1 Tax=Tribonema minus TaxID=303371 RepID=A0A836C856_9STRA|nr:transcription factor Tfb2-domain-containing protein [Tribonema minus]
MDNEMMAWSHVVLSSVQIRAGDGAISKDLLKGWVRDAYTGVHRAAVRQLSALRVLVRAQELSGAAAAAQQQRRGMIALNPPFRKNLLQALLTPDVAPWKDDPRFALRPDKLTPSRAKIEGEMRRKWEAVLHFLVASDGAGAGPTPSVRAFMQQAGLMARRGRSEQLVITNRGYEFMLRDIHVQAWMFVLSLIRSKSSDAQARDDLLSFLFMLSYCTVSAALQPLEGHHNAQSVCAAPSLSCKPLPAAPSASVNRCSEKVCEDYPLLALTPAQAQLARDFIDLGLLYQRKPSSQRFYTTEIAVNLVFGAAAAEHPSRAVIQAADASAQLDLAPRMTIIVETNFQVVAYTTSDLHVAMLTLFLELRARLPNMVIGVITRESVRQALVTGIKASQILNFLKWHAHPNVINRRPMIPENIADQIILWERERTRVKYDAGTLLDLPFEGVHDFDKVAEYAEELGACLWAAREKRVLIVAAAAVNKVVAFADGLMPS